LHLSNTSFAADHLFPFFSALVFPRLAHFTWQQINLIHTNLNRARASDDVGIRWRQSRAEVHVHLTAAAPSPPLDPHLARLGRGHLRVHHGQCGAV